MENREEILIISTIQFFLLNLNNILAVFVENLMQAQFDIDPSKVFSSLNIWILAAFALGVMFTGLIKVARIGKKELHWIKIKKNQRLLIMISLLLIILIEFIFIYQAKSSLNVDFSIILLLDSVFVWLAYGMGTAVIFTKEILCKITDRKAEQYGDDKEKEEAFRVFVNVGVIIGLAILIAFLYWMVLGEAQ